MSNPLLISNYHLAQGEWLFHLILSPIEILEVKKKIHSPDSRDNITLFFLSMLSRGVITDPHISYQVIDKRGHRCVIKRPENSGCSEKLSTAMH